MHDLLFETQSEWAGQSNIDELFADYVASLDLDQAAFAERLESGRHEAAVEENVQEAQLHGVTGTPTMFINGYSLFRGAQPYEVFDLLVGYAEKWRAGRPHSRGCCPAKRGAAGCTIAAYASSQRRRTD